MGVDLSVEGTVCVVRLAGALTAADVDSVARHLVEVASAQDTKVSVLGIVRGLPRMPSKEARLAMRSNRDALREACYEVHVVLESGGWLGVGIAAALRTFSARTSRVQFHGSEKQARRALLG